ncbi:MAG: LptF/LptG family permease [Gammaproteobacteria bacterium]|nr:LptF/LptG family permease [Gammaproteobacteria bacterium]
MRVLRMDLHLGLAVTQASLLVLVVFLVVSLIFAYIGESVNSDLPAVVNLRTAIELLPQQAQVILPFAIFIGTLIGIGNLANANELTVFRTSGVSQLRLFITIGSTMLVLYVICVAAVEGYVALTQSDRSHESSGESILRSNEWIEEGGSFTFTSEISDQGELRNLTQFIVPEGEGPMKIRRANTARYDETSGIWRLSGVVEYSHGSKVESRGEGSLIWNSRLTPDYFVSKASVKAKEMSILALLHHVSLLDSVGVSNRQLVNEYWVRVYRVFTLIGLGLLALAFVLSASRQTAIGTRIAMGLLIGLTFHLVQDFTAPISLVLPIHPVINMSVPVIVLFGSSIYLLHRSK